MARDYIKKTKNIWIFAGGTGGHISPALSLADYFSQKKVSFIFFTLPKNLDYPGIDKVKAVSYPALPIPKNLFLLVKFLKSSYIAWNLFEKENKKKKVSAVIAMGGYPCFIPLLWALFKRVPYYLCEQNVVLGKITRIFSRFARVVFLSFADPTLKVKKKSKKNYIVSGNPLRKDFIPSKLVKNKSVSSHKNLAYPSLKTITVPARRCLERVASGAVCEALRVKKILLLGGSQGAYDINNLYLTMIKRPTFKNMSFTLVTGKDKFSKMKTKHTHSNRKQDKIVDFIKDMHSALFSHDLIIARAGSSTIFEIMSSRKPAIFLPYPYATNDHQKQNALYLEKQGLAKTIDIRPFHAEAAVQLIEDIFSTGELKILQNNLLTHKIPLNAHKTISETVLKDQA